MSGLTVFAFSPAWGLPTSGPFALKLLKWLDLAGLPYRLVAEDRSEKGPLGKNPWIEFEGQRIGDSEVIIDLLRNRSGFDIDRGLTADRAGRAHAARRMLEEHFHQVLEWELFVHPAGAAYIREAVGKVVPGIVAGAVAARICGHFRRQLHARGIARHPDALIAAKGIADLEAMESLLGDQPFLGGDRPSLGDVSAYGLLSPMARWPMKTPVADNLKSRPALIGYLDRMAALRVETPATAAA